MFSICIDGEKHQEPRGAGARLQDHSGSTAHWAWASEMAVEFGGGFVFLCEKFCVQILLIETILLPPPFNMIRRIFKSLFRR